MRFISKLLLLAIFALIGFNNLVNSPDYSNYILHINSDYLDTLSGSYYGYYSLLLLVDASEFDFVFVLWFLNWITLSVVLLRKKYSIYFVLCYGIMFGWIWHTVQLRQGAIMFIILILLSLEIPKKKFKLLASLFGLFWHRVVFLVILNFKVWPVYVLLAFLLMQIFIGLIHPLNTFNMFTTVVFLAIVLFYKTNKKINVTLLVLLACYFIGGLFDTILASRSLELSLLVVLTEIDSSRYKYYMFIPFVMAGLSFRNWLVLLS